MSTESIDAGGCAPPVHAPTQGRRAEVVAWARMSHDGSAIADICLPCEMQSVEMWAYGVKELVYADTLAEMQRRVELIGELADKLATWLPGGNDPVGPLHGAGMAFAYRDAAKALRALLSPEPAASEEPK